MFIRFRFLIGLLMLLCAARAVAQGSFNPDNPPEPLAKYKVSVACTPAEAAYTSGAGKYTEGTSINIRTSSRGSNYTFVHWLKNGEVYSDQLSFTYVMEAKSVSFTAVWRFDPSNPPEPTAKNEYRIYLVTDMDGACSFNRSSGAKAEAGSNVYLRTYNNQGFRFLGWYEGETLVNSNATFYYTMPSRHVTLTAHYCYDPDSPADPQSNQSSIENYLLGDVNDDGYIDVTDFICVANNILGQPQEVFVRKAADIDRNDIIDVNDFIGVANLILNGAGKSTVAPLPVNNASVRDLFQLYVNPPTKSSTTP